MDINATRKQDFVFAKQIKLGEHALQKLNSLPEDQKTSPTYNLLYLITSFQKADTLRDFKDSNKKLRKLFSQHPDLLKQQEHKEFLLDLILAFCHEQFFGIERDIKGVICELI